MSTSRRTRSSACAPVLLSVSEAAREFGYHRQTIAKRIAELGIRPSGTRNGHPVYRVRDLLRGLLLASGNDAAATLAVCAAGSRAAFVARMNAKARALGLADTRFANPVGLDAPTNYSTPADLARLGIALCR